MISINRTSRDQKKRRPKIRLPLGLAIIIAILQTAGTSCQRPTIARSWINPEPANQDLSRLEIDYNCGKNNKKSYDPLRNALWLVKAHARCARADCIWGRAEGITQRNGNLLATYNTFSAIRKILISDEGGLLKVDVMIDYRDNRPTKRSTHYLQPAD